MKHVKKFISSLFLYVLIITLSTTAVFANTTPVVIFDEEVSTESTPYIEELELEELLKKFDIEFDIEEYLKKFDTRKFDISEFDIEYITIDEFSQMALIPVPIEDENSRTVGLAFVHFYYTRTGPGSATVSMTNLSKVSIGLSNIDVRITSTKGYTASKQHDMGSFAPNQTKTQYVGLTFDDIRKVVITFIAYIPLGYPSTWIMDGVEFDH